MSIGAVDYASLKEFAKKTGKRVTDLIALSRNHDPFYVGTPTKVTMLMRVTKMKMSEGV